MKIYDISKVRYIEPNQKKVFMIVGTNRSGSTLLDLMLGNDTNGMSIGEVYALFRPWKPHHPFLNRKCSRFCKLSDEEALNVSTTLKKYVLFSMGFKSGNETKLNKKNDCQFWTEIKSGGENNLYYNIFKKKPNLNFIVDSSKDPLWLKDQLKYSKNKDYTIIPIIIFKVPLEYAYSRYKRDNLEGWKNYWIKTYSRLFSIIEVPITVSYQDLAKNPSSKLKTLCNKLNIKYREGKKEFWKNQHDHFLFGSYTVRSSKKLVYYEEQYDDEKLHNLKNLIDTDDKKLKDTLKVLDAYEVDNPNTISNSMLQLKNQLSNYSFYDRVRMRMVSTPYYIINRSLSIAKNFP